MTPLSPWAQWDVHLMQPGLHLTLRKDTINGDRFMISLVWDDVFDTNTASCSQMGSRKAPQRLWPLR